jgi:nucleotide-binding universal stress UspA family protein
MKKIIAALDSLKFSDSATAYAISIAKHGNAHLVGVFLDDVTYHSYKLYELIKENGTSLPMLSKLEEKDKKTRIASVKKFEAACKGAGINYSLHHDRSIASKELLHESIYADLLIVDSKETLTHFEEEIPTRFIRDLLTDVQCPVLLTPRKYLPIEKIVLLYDGEPSSVHAIKMFNYLLPELMHFPTEVISVKSIKKDLHLPDNKLMKEFMKRHYPTATFMVLKGLPEIEIIHHLKGEKQNILVVLGAYRRGMVSRWFRESMADMLMKELKVPLFIAHNK